MKFVLPSLFLVSIQWVNAENLPPRLEEIVVTSSAIEMPREKIGTSVSVLTKDDIQLSAYHSFAELLSTQMSVSTTNSGGLGKVSSLRIRGEEGFRTLILIDEVDISDPTGTQVGPQVQHLVNSADIERIELLRGPQGFIYGADAGGVINVSTQKPTKGVVGGAKFEYGEFETRDLEGFIALGNEKGDAFISISDLDSEGFNAREGFAEEENDGYKNQTAHFKFGLNFPSTERKNRLQLVMRKVSAESEFDSCADFTNPSDNCISEFDQAIGKLSFSTEGEIFSQQVSYSVSDLERDSIEDGANAFSSAGGQENLAYRGKYFATDRLSIVFGADRDSEHVDADAQDLERSQLGIYSELQSQWGDVYVNLGLRYDDNEDFGDHLSKRVSTAYTQSVSVDTALKYRLSYGTGFRAPSLFEIDYNQRNGFGEAAETALTEEMSKGFDVGVEWHHSGGAFVELGLFDQTITDEIQFDLVAFSGYLQRSGESRSKGLELAFLYPLSSNFEIFGNYTHNNTEDSRGRQRARRPENMLNVGGQLAFMENRMQARINYRQLNDRVDYAFSGEKSELDDYALLDISLRYKASESFDVFARVNNLADEKYNDLQGFNTAGRAISLGLQLQLK